MNILHVNTHAKGGAANACIGLHHALLEQGVASTLLTLRSAAQEIAHHYVYRNMVPATRKSLQQKITNKILARKHQRQAVRKNDFMAKVCQEADHFSFLDTEYDITQLEVFKKADIINLHWTADFLDWPSFFSAHNQKKIVWTLHDMHPFTGGYHYAGNYRGYQREDQAYPPAQSSYFPSITQEQLQRKKTILQQFKSLLNIVSPSHWLYDASRSSALFRDYPHHVIPYSVDINVFQPLDKHFCRKLLNLPSDKLILLFVSQDVNKRRKGFKKLVDSLPLLADQELLVCSVGSVPTEINSRQIQHIPLGSIQDARLMAVAYNAADAFVVPSLEDNLPNTVLEALACATPVIGFDTGGIKDMVKNGFNGYLSEQKTEAGLKEVILHFVAHTQSMNLPAIREDTVTRYRPSVQADAYQKLYQSLIDTIA